MSKPALFSLKTFLIVYSLVSLSSSVATAQTSPAKVLSPAEVVELVNTPDLKMSKEALAEQMLAAVKVRFETKKVKFVDRGTFLGVESEGDTELNRFAAKLEQRYNSGLVFEPKRLIGDGGRRTHASTVSFDSDGKTYGLLFLSIEAALLDTRILRDIVLLHEVRHLHQLANLQKRIPSPFYGMISAQRGVIPDSVSPTALTYRRYLSFDEILTFRSEGKQGLIKLKRLIRNNPDVVLDDNAIFLDVDSALYQTTLLSLRISSAIAAVEAKFEPFSNAEFKMVESVPTAVLTLETDAETAIEYKIPLVGSKGLDDRENARLAAQQISSTRTASIVVAGQTIEARKLLEQLKENPKLSLKEKLQLIDQAQASLPANNP